MISAPAEELLGHYVDIFELVYVCTTVKLFILLQL